VEYYECISQDITQRKQAELEMRRLSHLLLEAQEAERKRVAQELHDGVNQLLASAKMRLGKLADRLPDVGPANREILKRCEQLLVQALEENRTIAHNLRPTDLDHLGLAPTCRNYCREFALRSGLTVKHRISGFAESERLSPGVELNLFRILQEALNNIQKHARAKTVQVHLSQTKGTVRLKVSDDGRGMTRERKTGRRTTRSGAGLSNMRERATALGANYEVVSLPNQGTTLTISVPVDSVP